MIRRICMIVTLLGAMLLIGCSGCAACSSAPELEDVYDRIVYLIEESKEINTVIYGEGLPVYEIDSDYAKYTRLYGDESDRTDMISYELVSEYAKFQSDTEIKEAAEKIYTDGCLKAIYSYLFDGSSISDSQNGIVVEKAKYNVGDAQFGQSRSDESLLTGTRIYDYSTIEIIQPSDAETIRISVDSWMESSPERIEKKELVLALVDGQWYLDSFAG